MSLKCIVTGAPHSGTTVLSSMIGGFPNMTSEFETGFLHRKDISSIAVDNGDGYYRKARISWQLTDDNMKTISEAKSWEEVYDRLKNISRTIKNDESIVDKTPEYIYQIKRVLERVDVPVFIIYKDPRCLYFSYKKRKIANIPHYMRCYQLMEEVKEYDNVYIIKSEDLRFNVEETAKRVCSILDVEWDEKLLTWEHVCNRKAIKTLANQNKQEYNDHKQLTPQELQSITNLKQYFYFND